jgi:hypothetical protein
VVVEEPAPEPPAVRTFTVTVQGLGEFVVSVQEQ